MSRTCPHPIPFPRDPDESWAAYVARIREASEQAATRRRDRVMANPEAVKQLRRLYGPDTTGKPAWNGFIPLRWKATGNGWEPNTSPRRRELLQILEVAA